MSATTVCLDPRRCRAKSHVIGTAAHRACAAPGRLGASPVGAPPPPPAGALSSTGGPGPDWTGLTVLGHGRDVKALHDALNAAHADAGWDPDSGEIHPAGGYDEVEVEWAGGASATSGWKVTYTLDGVPHREDGPATHRRTRTGKVVETSFRAKGLGGLYLLDAKNRDVAPARYKKLAESSPSPRHAIAWLALESRAATRGLADQVGLGEGADPWLALSAWDAGVRENETLRQVATGELPLSWAIAGAGPGDRVSPL